VTLETAQLTAKRIELHLPTRVQRCDPADTRDSLFERGPILVQWIRDSEAAAQQLGLSFELVDVGLVPTQWEPILQALSRRGINAATIIETPAYLVHRAPLAEAALKARLAVMFPFPEQAEAGVKGTLIQDRRSEP
jgi:hypothetical protein